MLAIFINRISRTERKENTAAFDRLLMKHARVCSRRTHFPPLESVISRFNDSDGINTIILWPEKTEKRRNISRCAFNYSAAGFLSAWDNSRQMNRQYWIFVSYNFAHWAHYNIPCHSWMPATKLIDYSTRTRLLYLEMAGSLKSTNH